MWRERLEHAVLFPALWMRHPRRDAYWKHGSVGEDWPAIACPVYAVGGWADGYTNAVPRLVHGLQVPRRGLVGPWGHMFPHEGVPGPRIGFLQEALGWWERWLRDDDGGAPRRAAVPSVDAGERAPAADLRRSGRDAGSPRTAWPSPRILPRRFVLQPGRLDDEPGLEAELRFRSPQTTGQRGGDWCAFGAEGEMPADQRPDDGRSLCFDSEPLRERMEILGAPAPAPGSGFRSSRRARRRAPVRRGRRRSLDARHLGPVEPDPPRQSRVSLAARAGPALHGASSRSTTSRTRSRLATACAWRSRPPTGRSPGRRPSR